jgi:hypothetical protein
MLAVLHWIAALLILAEAMNKAERTDALRGGLTRRERAAEWLKGIAWVLLALGSAGVLVAPLLPPAALHLADDCVCIGFAVLIVRTRVKEG